MYGSIQVESTEQSCQGGALESELHYRYVRSSRATRNLRRPTSAGLLDDLTCRNSNVSGIGMSRGPTSKGLAAVTCR